MLPSGGLFSSSGTELIPLFPYLRAGGGGQVGIDRLPDPPLPTMALRVPDLKVDPGWQKILVSWFMSSL